MILTGKDLAGSINDRPEYKIDYEKNRLAFIAELDALRSLAPGHPGWNGAMFYYQVYKDKVGYRLALPAKFLPCKVDGHKYIDGFVLSNTVFPNQYQASKIAADIVHDHIGH